ncbi:MAG TPA: YraN family protein [Candidatus Moranbacteria bacterium]|nr:YraN family protein [Candidatus Moranbacteria bacterium]
MFWKKKNKNIGSIGEELAGQYLKKKGFKLIEFNYENKLGRRLGEIDIVAEKNDELVFVEVKTRLVRKGSVVFPEENITRDKLHKLQKIARDYIRENDFWNKSYHFDAVSVLLSEENNKVLEIRHLESIFY